MDKTSWSYNEFLAFLLIYGAEMNYTLSKDELEFIKKRTGITDIEKIKNQVESISDAEAMELIDNYKKMHLPTEESKTKTKRDLEELLKTPVNHSQLEKVVVHLMEKLI